MKRHVAVAALLCVALLATACATKPAAEPPAAKLPRLCGLLVGAGPLQKLDSIAKKDVKDFEDAQFGAGLYRSAAWKILVDEDATQKKIREGLRWIESCARDGDMAVAFFSGHAVVAPNNLVYFLPWDSDWKKGVTTDIDGCEIAATMQRLPGNSLLFVDTSYAGRIADCRAGAAEPAADRKRNLVMFFSSTDAVSMDIKESRNGAFTRAVVEGLSGKAGADATGHLTYKMLDAYVARRVQELTEGKQKPVTVSDAPDFPIKVIKQEKAATANR